VIEILARSAGRRERCGQLAGDVLNLRLLDGTVGVEALGEGLSVQEEVPSQLLGPKKGEIGLRETEGAAYRNFVVAVTVKRCADGGGDLAPTCCRLR
jgi:hypothetical protein